MIYSVNFLDMAAKIDHFSFVKYLEYTDWVRINIKRNDVAVFQKHQNQKLIQVNIPLDSSFSDYARSMYSSIEQVSLVEDKSVEQVMLYLLNPNTDILKIRLDKPSMDSGNITLDDAINLYNNTKKLICATAQDIMHPKTNHQGRIDDSIHSFLSDCRFGQTEIGSYIISIVCPFAELKNNEYTQLSFFSEDDRCAHSLTRKVTNRLIENINIIKNNIDNGKIQDLINEKEHIISANFYEALSGLNLNSAGTTIDLQADWSPVVKTNRFEHNKITLTSDYYEPIKSIIQKLNDEKPSCAEVIGRISKLEALPSVDERQSGKITITYMDDDNKKKNLTTTLESTYYEIAVLAHLDGKYVKAVGEIHIKNNRILMACEDFCSI